MRFLLFFETVQLSMLSMNKCKKKNHFS